jgi:hypothetical protein
MTHNAIMFLLCAVLLQSCNSQTKNKAEDKVEKTSVSLPFDLASLTLNEDINEILSSVKLSKKDTVQSDDLTYLGNERIAFNIDKVLNYKGINLKGENNKNNVVFHYGVIDSEIGPVFNERNNILGMYQLNIYTEIEKKTLFEALEKTLNKPVFDTIDEWLEPNIVDNNITLTKNKIKREVYVWKKRDLIYYYFKLEIQNSPQKDICNLFVFNSKHKEWMKLLNAVGYPHLDKILK